MTEREQVREPATSGDAEPTVDPADGTTWAKLVRLWSRIGHVYRTRIRTSTVLLVVAFWGGLVLYAWAAPHYQIGTTQERVYQRPPTSKSSEPSSSTPTSTVRSTPSRESSSTSPSDSEQDSVRQGETGESPSSTTTDWRDRIPGFNRTTEQPTTTTTRAPNGQGVPGQSPTSGAVPTA